MATPIRPFDGVPDEILLHVLSRVNATDHLSVKLVSWRLRGCAIAIDTTTLTLAEASRCHAAIEATFPRNRALVCCCCTHCGQVKDTDQFSDPQARRRKANRTCIECGIQRLVYSKYRLPIVGREERIPCYDCLQSMPLYDGWKLKSVEARLLLHLDKGKTYCEDCLEFRLRDQFSTIQERNQAIARIHADPVFAWHWQNVGV